jgi:hypothetical protein
VSDPWPIGRSAWIRATFLGWALGFVLVLVFLGVSGLLGLGDTQFPVGLGMGLGVGLLQGRLVGKAGLDARRWWLASAGGAAAPFLVHDVASLFDVGVPFSLAAYVMVAGLVVGLLQTSILPGRSAWWAVGSAAAWSSAGAVVYLNDMALPKIPGLPGAGLYVTVLLGGGLLLGLVSWIALQATARRGRRPAPADSAAQTP